MIFKRVLKVGGGVLRHPDRLDDLENCGTANDKNEQGQQPRTDGRRLFFLFLEVLSHRSPKKLVQYGTLTDVLGTFPLIVTILLAFSLAIRILCFGAMAVFRAASLSVGPKNTSDTKSPKWRRKENTTLSRWQLTVRMRYYVESSVKSVICLEFVNT